MSEYMTLEELFKELHLNKDEKRNAMENADRNTQKLYEELDMKWKNDGWHGVNEEQRRDYPD